MSALTTMPSQLLWEACGAPPSPKASALPTHLDGDWTRCWVCSGATGGRGMPVARWDGANFTGQTRIRYPGGQAICEPCLWVMARATPVPGKTGNWRNYSVLYEHGHAPVIASKGDKPVLRAWLRAPRQGPWFAALANSGQKHVVPYVPLNRGGSRRVLFDEELLDLPSSEAGWAIVDELTALLTAGATKEEVERGDYGTGTIRRCEASVRAFEARHGRLRGSAWFGLVVFLAQRDEEAVAARLAAEAEARKAKAAQQKATAPRARRVQGATKAQSTATKPRAQKGKAKKVMDR